MKPNWKKVADCVGNALLALIVISLLCLWIKPLLESSDYAVKNLSRTADLLTPVNKKDEKALAELEKLSYRDNYVAFIALNAFYREAALNKSGVDLETPNASFDSVDLSKPNSILLRGIEQLSDYQLLYLLKHSDYLFDDAAVQAELDASGKYFDQNVKDQNRLRFHVYNSFDQATRDNLKACKVKLEAKMPNTLLKVINYHSFGACTDSPPTPFSAQFISHITNW